MSIDDKLKEILLEDADIFYDGVVLPDYQGEFNKLVLKIKQAFADNGYVDASRMLEVAKLIEQQAGILKYMAEVNLPPVYGTGLMTGQEFYDRFKQKLAADPTVSYNGDLLALVRRVARIE